MDPPHHRWQRDQLDALDVSPEARRQAEFLLSALPASFPLAEISVDRDGDVYLEWDFGPSRVMSASVAHDGTLNYAGLFGDAAMHGTEMLGESVPSALLDGIRRATDAPNPNA